MVGPQTEDGYTKIANELFDALICANLSKRQYKVVFAVIRLTYGYNKKMDAISMWRLSSMSGMDRANVSRTVEELTRMNVIIRLGSGITRHGKEIWSLGINKMHGEWETEAKTAPVPKWHQCQNGTQTDAKMAHRPMPKWHIYKDKEKDNTKDKDAREWLDKSLWSDFLAFRRQIKKPMGDVAIKRMLSKLERMKAEGHDPNEALERSIENGWQGVFVPKPEKNKPSDDDWDNPLRWAI